MRRLSWIVIAHCFLVTGILVSCARNADLEVQAGDGEVVNDDGNIEQEEDPSDYIWDDSEIVSVTLNGNSIVVEDTGVIVSGTVVTFVSSGTYQISGLLNDGQLIVNTADESIVRLILDGVDISCSTNAAIYVENAEKTMIVLAYESENYIADANSYSEDESEVNAAIFSKDLLIIYGTGSLQVNGNYEDGISSKDELIIYGGTVSVSAVDDGIRGKDYLTIKDGEITVIAGGDGLKSDNDEDSGKGYVSIESGLLDVTSEGDAISASTDVIINDGEINIKSGGGSSESVSGSESAKGIKSELSIMIKSGSLKLNSADDAIHSDGDITVSGSVISIASGDDGLHAESDLTISGGEITITKSYEGLESALGNISISGGSIHITSSDDGINLAAGGDNQGGGGGGGPHKSTSADYVLSISGGYLVIDADGDGIDSNDMIKISGGTQLVNGPTSNSNGALDFNGSCTVDGGFLLALGSSGMAESPGSSSGQSSVLLIFNSQVQSGKILHIEDNDGNGLLTYKASKNFQSVVFSSSDLKEGETYHVYVGGSSSGTAVDGLYSGGDYTGGTLYGSFTVNNKVTQINI